MSLGSRFQWKIFIASVRDHTRSRYETNEFFFSRVIEKRRCINGIKPTFKESRFSYADVREGGREGGSEEHPRSRSVFVEIMSLTETSCCKKSPVFASALARFGNPIARCGAFSLSGPLPLGR